MDSNRRLVAIDYVKAAAIIAVVFNHSGVATASPLYSSWDFALRHAWVGFHVPAFLLVAGFLYSREEPYSVSDVWRRLARILILYLIASAIVFLSPYWLGNDVASLAHALAFGSALGIYYFVFALTLCILSTWVLSRVSQRTLLALLLLALAYVLSLKALPWLRVYSGHFWLIRDPFLNFYFGYFLAGWLAALNLPALERIYQRYRLAAWLVFAASIALHFGSLSGWSFPVTPQAIRIAYALSVVCIIILLTRSLSLHPIVRTLSDTSLAIYLFHRLFEFAALPYTLLWHPALRVLCLALIGLSASIAFCLVGRRIFGRRWARTLLGA